MRNGFQASHNVPLPRMMRYNVETLLFLARGWDMAITTLSSREFNQDASRAKKAAKRGPVFLTDRGRPAHVLLTIEEYRRITNKQENILDLLSMPEAAEVEFEPPRLSSNFHRPADLS
jgi:prevent-host-death family protein